MELCEIIFNYTEENRAATEKHRGDFLIENSLNLLKRKIMNIQAEKLELIRMILDTDNPGILASIKHIFTDSKKVDFWDTLSQSQKDEILEGINEIENGDTFDYEEFIKNHR